MDFGRPVSKNREAEDIWSVEEELDWQLDYFDDAARSKGWSHVPIHENPHIHITNNKLKLCYASFPFALEAE